MSRWGSRVFGVWVLVVAFSAIAASAGAATVVSGAHNSTSPLVIDPSGSAGSVTPEVNTPGTVVAFIERMPASKVVDHVTLGDLGQVASCAAPTRLSLLVYESATNELKTGPTPFVSSTGANRYVNVPSSPGKVTWTIPPAQFRAGYGYSFMVSTYDGCNKVRQTTWPHNGTSVDGGAVKCTSAPSTAPSSFGGLSRMWHTSGGTDRSAPCVDLSKPLGVFFDPSMPTGWLVTNGSYVLGGQNFTTVPPDTMCGTAQAAMGAKAVWWRQNPTYGSGHSDYVCMWSQYSDFSALGTDGWYYAGPWRTENGPAGPRDMYVKLSTTSKAPAPSEFYGGGNPADPNLVQCQHGDPVDCATGNFFETQADLAVGGRGLGLDVARTYNAQAAVAATARGRFGYGWTGSYGERLSVDPTSGDVTVTHANGSTVSFSSDGAGGYFAPGWVQATLAENGDGTYTYTLPDHSRSLRFDASGRLTSEADRNGNTTTLTYDGDGHLASATDPAGRSLTFAYNADGTVDHATDPAGHRVQYGYDGSGNLTSVTDAAAGVTHFGYDGSHRLTSVTDPRGHVVTTNVYDASNRVVSQIDALNRTTTWDYATPGHTKITDPAGRVTDEQFQNMLPVSVTKGAGTAAATTWTYAYDADGNQLSKTDAGARTWQSGYDDQGNRTSITDPVGHRTSWTFNASRDVTSVTTPSGHETDFGYDTHGNPTSTSRTLTRAGQPDVTQTSSAIYDADGNLTSTTDPLGHTTTYAYDGRGDLLSRTDPLGNTTSWTYDDDSRTASVTSPRGNVSGANPADFTTTITRDALGRVTAGTDPLGHTNSTEYDADGNVLSATDPSGRKSTFGYDDANEPTSATRAGGATTQTAYDPAGLVATSTDANGHDTTYAHDAAGRVSSITGPLSRVTHDSYDTAGRLTTQTDPSGRDITFSYNDAGAVTGIDYQDPGTHDVSFGFDADGRRTSMIDATGQTSYDYDSLGRLVSVTDGDNKTVSYAYDLADRQTSITYPGGDQVSRGYDDADRLTGVTDWLNHTTGFGYDADGNQTSVSYPQSTSDVDMRDYDDAGRITAEQFKHASSTRAGLDYGYNPSGQVTAVTGSGALASGHNFGYDTPGRLASDGTDTFTFDPADQLTSLRGAQQAYDAAGQLTQTTNGGQSTSYQFDANGNRTQTTPTTGASTDYGYDQADQLISVDDRTNPAISYSYAADGLRATKTTGTTTTKFVWDRSAGIPVLLSADATRYVYDGSGAPIEQITDSGQITYLHHDRIGSTRLATDTDGTVTAAYDYDPYGQRITLAGSSGIPFGYTGQYTDPDTGLVYLRARDYDPTTGQFLTRDPLEDLTGTPYAYAGGDPVNATDPLGLISWSSVGSTISNAAAGILDGATAGYSTKLAGAVFGFNAGCADFSSGFGAGQALGLVAGFADGEGEVSLGARALGAAEAGSTRLIGPAGDAAASGLSRVDRFRAMASDGIQVGDQRFGINPHLINSIRKSGRRHITPEDLIDALHQRPVPGTPGSRVYTNPNTGTRFFVNGAGEVVGAHPAGFR